MRNKKIILSVAALWVVAISLGAFSAVNKSEKQETTAIPTITPTPTVTPTVEPTPTIPPKLNIKRQVQFNPTEVPAQETSSQNTRQQQAERSAPVQQQQAQPTEMPTPTGDANPGVIQESSGWNN